MRDLALAVAPRPPGIWADPQQPQCCWEALWNGSKACHAFDIEARGAVCMQDDTCPDYMLKAEECLRQEEERVTNYLHVDSKQKLLVEVEREVLEQYETELLEKEHSGCSALLRDDKVRTVLPEILIRFCPASICAPRRLAVWHADALFLDQQERCSRFCVLASLLRMPPMVSVAILSSQSVSERPTGSMGNRMMRLSEAALLTDSNLFSVPCPASRTDLAAVQLQGYGKKA